MLLVGLFGFLLTSCAQTRTANVEPLSFASDLLPSLDGRTVAVLLVDTRGGARGEDPSESIFESLQRANPTAHWIRVQSGADADLVIKISVFESTFSLGNWTGTVEFNVEQPRLGNNRFPVQRSVTLSNLWGYKSADDALRQAYKQAMSELIAKLS